MQKSTLKWFLKVDFSIPSTQYVPTYHQKGILLINTVALEKLKVCQRTIILTGFKGIANSPDLGSN